MTRPRFAPVFIASALVALLAVGYMFAFYLPSYNTPHTPVEAIARTNGFDATAEGSDQLVSQHLLVAPPALARRLVFVVMDGLSFDLAHDLEQLQTLRRNGVLRMLRAPFPTYTSPALISFVTGLDPRDHGVRLNREPFGVFGLDTVTLAAHDAFVPAHLHLRGWQPFQLLMYPTRDEGSDLPRKPPPTVQVHSGRIEFVSWMLSRAISLHDAPDQLQDQTQPHLLEFTLVYLEEVDRAGHIYGAASPQYLEAARHTATLVDRLASTLDLDRDAIVIVSDHAHRAEGGHGGTEPGIDHAFFLAAGSVFRQGVELAARPTRDVASTLSVLGALRVPALNMGRPMLDAFQLDDAQHAWLLAKPFHRAAKNACSVFPSDNCASVDALATRLAKADPEAWPPAEALLDSMAASRNAAATAQTLAASKLRISLAAVALAAALAALWTRRRAYLFASIRLLAYPLLFAVAYCTVLWLFDHRPTFSSLVGENYSRDTFLASTAAVLLTFFASVIARPSPLLPWVLLAVIPIPFALLAVWVGVNPALLPPPIEGLLIFEFAPMMLGVAFVATAITAFQRWSAKALQTGPVPNPQLDSILPADNSTHPTESP